MERGWIVSLVFFFSFLLALLLCVFFLYIPEAQAEKAANCNVVDCDITQDTCADTQCYSNSGCISVEYDCWKTMEVYELCVKGICYNGTVTVYYDYQSDAQSFCNSLPSSITCYYAITDPGGTMSLNSDAPKTAGVATVVVFTILAFFALVLFGVCFMLRK